MVDSQRMAMVHGIQDLKEGVLGQCIVADEPTMLGDVGEEIAFGTILQHHKRTIRAIQNSRQGDHVRVMARVEVESDLATLEPLLSSIQSCFRESLDSVRDMGEDVDGFVHHTVGTHTQDGY